MKRIQYCLLSIMAFVLLLTGCATFQGILAASDNPILQRTIQYAVIRHMAANPGHQEEAVRVIEEVRKAIDRPVLVSVGDLKQVAIAEIPWDKMHPADKFFLQELLKDIAAHIEVQVGDGVLDEEDKVRVRDVLTWIEQAVRFPV